MPPAQYTLVAILGTMIRRILLWGISVVVFVLAAIPLLSYAPPLYTSSLVSLGEAAWNVLTPSPASTYGVLSSRAELLLREARYVAITALFLTWPLLFPRRAMLAALASFLPLLPMLTRTGDMEPLSTMTAFPSHWLAVVLPYHLRSYTRRASWVSAVLLGLSPLAIFGASELALDLLTAGGTGLVAVVQVVVLFSAWFAMPVVSVVWFIWAFLREWRAG